MTEEVSKLAAEQEQLGKDIQRCFTNMKKDPVNRKNERYFDDRHNAINKIWKQIEEKHKQIEDINCPNHMYHTQKYFTQLVKLYEDTVQYMFDSRTKIAQQASQQKTRIQTEHLEELLREIKIELQDDIADDRRQQLQEKIKLRWSQLSDAYLDLEVQDIHQPIKSQYKDLEKLQESILLNLNTKTKVPSDTRDATAQSRACNISLPQIKLPIFDGEYEKWATFRDIFTNVVLKNNTLTDIERMQYLKTHLRGEASKLVQHLQITSTNYPTCWDILNRRYSNDRLISTKLIDKILLTPAIQEESAHKLKALHDTVRECLEALNNLNVDTTTWGPLINRVISQKWDSETNRLYEQSLLDPHKIQLLDDQMRFLQTRFQSLEALVHTKATPPKERQYQKTFHELICRYCSQSHSLHVCQKFKAIPTSARLKFVIDKGICKNCLKHTTSTMCQSMNRCQICNKFHHTILHTDGYKPESGRVQNKTYGPRGIPSSRRGPPHQQNNREQQRNTTNHIGRQNETVFLATALTRVTNNQGVHEYLRILVDPGSQSTFMTEEAAALLGLPRQRIQADVSGLGGESQVAKWMVEATIRPRFSSTFSLQTKCIILPKLTSTLPSEHLSINTEIWQNDILADPTYQQPGPIDIILGAKEYGEIILEGLHKTDDGLLGQNTELGWILSGNIQRKQGKRLQVLSLTTSIEEDKQLTKFWEIEEIPQQIQLSEEDQFCEDHYAANTTRNRDGSYTVRIPFNDHQTNLGTSRTRAAARLIQLEKRFSKDKQLQANYIKFMEEYINLGHIVLCQPQPTTELKYFIPHQPVIKETSTTTKLRVVFDASSKTTSGISLNETMYTGPRLQQELSDILLRWRSHKIALAADIEKMYRQVKIHPDDQVYHAVLWRPNPREQIQEYKLTTVTYGTTAAPYLAVKTIQRLAEDEKLNFPKAANVAMQDFYVDDLLSGANSVKEAIDLQQELIQMFKSGGFTLHKWSSNNKQLLNHIDDKLKDGSVLEITEDWTRKSLGIRWAPNDDTIRFKTKKPEAKKITKRVILSEVAKLFDPLGWLAPIVINAKLLIQELWLQNLPWDGPVPIKIQTKWEEFVTKLSHVDSIVLPRWTYQNQNSITELHGFCDASEKAYGAAIYIKVMNSSEKTEVILLTAKSKVAPAKQKTTIPRLELCAAVLLAKLLKRTINTLSLHQSATFAWTDSMIVLSWIKGNPTKWKTFVANRVSEINSLIPSQHWNHVPTEENPADIISRGMDPQKLKENTMWWNGPVWLQLTSLGKMSSKIEIPPTIEEAKLCHIATTKQNTIEKEITLRFSSLTKLVRTVSYCARFSNKNVGPLSVSELRKTLETLIKREQQFHYLKEILSLKRKVALGKDSKILNLNPFLDNDGILRVGGRLENSQLSYNSKHPMILPYQSHLTQLIILDAHANTLHGGNQLTLTYTRKQYWIINGKKAVKNIIGRCVKCIRFKAKTAEQLMASLPPARVSPSQPFLHTGVDYAGPLQIKTTKGRGHKSYKGYIAIFVCLATKAIHLEVVSDMSTNTFLAAFRRFVSRRGRCAHMYSDNGTNFVGASKILQKEIYAATQNTKIQDEVTTLGTEWHFIPPAAPHFGGLWEAGVKSMKHHLKRTIGETCLTYEEMSTLMHQIEACLNSRPLCPLTEDVNNLNVLTPGHFLVGRPLVEPPDPITTEINTSLAERWKLIQKIKKDFWKQWTSGYLHQLQQRYKWKNQQKTPDIGEVVILKEDNIDPSNWPLAIVTDVHHSRDNLVRVVTLRKAKGGLIKRPIHKLVPLPVTTNEVINKERNTAKLSGPRKQNRNLWRIAYTAILFLIMLRQTSAQQYHLHYPQPGLYIEHIGHAKIDRGTFRIELRFDKHKINNDTACVASVITQVSSLCDTAKELAPNTQCTQLIQHLQEKQKQIEWTNKGMQAVISNRGKRGLMGKLLTSLFGVNDEVYMDIEKLDQNQRELIKTSTHQTKFMLHALSTFNETEIRINNHLKRFQESINQGIEAIKDMQHWYSQIDQNKLNIQLLSVYQIVANYIDDVLNYHKHLLEAHYHRGQFLELISPTHVEETITVASKNLPHNIKIISYPVLYTDVKHSKEFIHVFGFFIITEVNDFLLLKTTPIPLKITQEAYWILDVSSDFLAVDYNSQLYFQLTEEELHNCHFIHQDTYICSPTTTRNLEKSSNCILDEIYQRTENTSCPVIKQPIKSTIWKKLYTPNAWMFLSGNKLKVAVICEGIREDVTLNKTGIIQISPNCLIKTNRNILTPKRSDTTAVLGVMVHPIKVNVSSYSPASNRTISTIDEPVLDVYNSLKDLESEETSVEQIIKEREWKTLHQHSIISNVCSGILIVITIVLVGYLWYTHNTRTKPARPITHNDPNEHGIPLEPIHVYSSLPTTDDS